MATWMVHFRIADYFLDKITWLNKKCFIVGNIGPDCGEPNEDWSKFTPSANITHWIQNGANKQNIKAEDFYETYLTSSFWIDRITEIEDNYTENYSFYVGYYIHLLTDVLWSNIVASVIKKKYTKEYENQAEQFWWVIKKDWYDLDHLYLKKNPDFRAFRIFDKIKEFSNHYIEYYSETALIRQIQYISDFYNAEHDGIEREYTYLSEEDMNQFMTEALQEIEKVLKDKGILS